jgi:hypothetical protein
VNRSVRSQKTEGCLPGVWVILCILLLALSDDIRAGIEDDETSRPEFDVDEKGAGCDDLTGNLRRATIEAPNELAFLEG